MSDTAHDPTVGPDVVQEPRSQGSRGSYHIELFGAFSITRGGSEIVLPPDVQRLLAFLSVHEGRLPRRYVAGSLWPDSSEKRALGSLRSVLWRLRRHHPKLVEADCHHLSLAPGTTTDVRRLTDLASRLCHGQAVEFEYEPFTREFLPGWYEEWVVHEQDRLRQLSMHALDSIASHYVDRGLFAIAIDVLRSLVRLDPLRESTTRQLIEAHLAEGNRSEAVRLYARFATMLQDELAIRPSFSV